MAKYSGPGGFLTGGGLAPESLAVTAATAWLAVGALAVGELAVGALAAGCFCARSWSGGALIKSPEAAPLGYNGGWPCAAAFFGGGLTVVGLTVAVAGD